MVRRLSSQHRQVFTVQSNSEILDHEPHPIQGFSDSILQNPDAQNSVDIQTQFETLYGWRDGYKRSNTWRH